MSYQWYFNNSAITNATGSSLTVNGVTSANAGNYYVVVVNGGGSLNSSTATLTVIMPPTITTQPASQTINVSNNASFSVVATSTVTATYQWRAAPLGGGTYTNLVNGGSISGASTSILTISSAKTNWALNYQVIVANSAGSVTSSPAAILTIVVPPVITTLPASQTVNIASNATFSVVVTSAAPVTYQWQAAPLGGGTYTNLVNGGSITGANTNTLTLSSVKTNWALNYQVIVANSAGSITSNPAATLTVVPVTVTNTIAITNYSFENPTVAEGSFTNCGTGSPPGWKSSGVSAGVVAVINPGTNGTQEPWPSSTPSGVDGTNFCQIFATGANGTGMVYQDTGIKYQAGTVYQLTAAFGLQTNQFFATNSAMVFYNSLLVPVASNIVSPASLIRGGFTNLTLRYTGTGTEGGNGDIVIGFYESPTAVGLSYFDFDNVHLVAISTATASTNAYLASLAVNQGGALSPAFVSNGLSYLVMNTYSSQPTLTAINADLTATNLLICNGQTNSLASGAASLPLNLTLGMTNTAKLQVTAQDGITVNTYTVNLVEQPSLAAPKLTMGVSNGMLTLSWPADHLGYRLLTQTNNLSHGLSPNMLDWGTVSGSTAMTFTNMPVSTANPTEFFQLVYP